MDLGALLEPLTPRERLYVAARLKGLSEKASCLAAGDENNPGINHWCKAEHVELVLRQAQEISAAEIGITRQNITDMLMQAFNNATTSLEQTAAARELARLHGLYAPAKVKVEHEHSHRIEDKRKQIGTMTNEQLMDLLAIPGEFTEVREPLLLERKDAET